MYDVVYDAVYDVVIIGAGASGLMAASRITSGTVAIIEGNSKMGLKILASGGGKCNVTNHDVTSNHYDGDSSFFNAVYAKLNNQDLLNLLKQKGLIPTKQDRLVKNQYFCKTSQEMLNYFQSVTRHAKIFFDTKVASVSYNKHFKIVTNKQTIEAKNIIVASGGISYTQLGATNIGYTIAEQFGHTTTRLDPCLVGFTVLPDQAWIKELSGLSTDVTLTVGDKKISGSMLCAHKGVSGPAVMVASLYWRKGKIALNFLPHSSLETLVAKGGKRNISSILPFPKRFAKAILVALQVKDAPYSALSKVEKESLKQLSSYEFAPAGTFGFKKAEVTRGGIITDTINPSTLESTLQKGLYFTGEVLDITGELGGYNLQWAFSSGYVCGEHINSKSRA